MTLEDFATQGLFTLDRKSLKDEQEQLQLDISYNYYVYMLFEKMCRIFKWDGLEDICDQRQLEVRLLADGFVGLVNDPTIGLFITRGSFNGITQYSDLPFISEYTNFLYSNPLSKIGGNPVIYHKGIKMKDGMCTVCNNTSLRTSVLPMVKRYASLLAHSDISIKCSLISLRESEIFAVEDDDVKKNVLEYHNKIYRGQPDVIVDSSMVSSIQDISQSKGSSNQSVLQAIDVRNQIERMFFEDMGVKKIMDKRERMVASEVESTGANQPLLLNLNDGLHCRQKFAEESNDYYGTKLKPDFTDEFKYLQEDLYRKEGEDNYDNKEISE